jgi:hypothetical protein
VPGWETEHPYDAAEVLAKARFAGSDEDCDAWLTDAGWGIRSQYEDLGLETAKWIAHANVEAQFSVDSDEDPWADLDITRALHEPPVMPSMMPRSDGLHLLYPGGVHWLTGEPECGKSWMALHAVADVLSWGGHVLFLDYENGLPLLERAVLLGIDPQRMSRQLHVKMMPPSWADVQERLLIEVQKMGVRLIVIDSAQSCMASAGLDPIDNADVLRFYTFVRRLTIGGASVLVLDHLPKGETASSRYPMGGGQKLAQATVAWGMQKRRHFGPGMTGQSQLYLHKDRHGHLRKFADTVGEHQMIGVFELKSDSLTGEADARVRPYNEITSTIESANVLPLPYQVMQAVTDMLIDFGDLPAAYLGSRIAAEKTKTGVALIELERRGYIELLADRPGKVYRARKPYRAERDADSPFFNDNQETP